MSIPQTLCPTCGTPHDDTRTQDEYLRGVKPPDCPLCNSGWDIWELRFAPIPLEKNRAQIASWLGQLPFPSAIDIDLHREGYSSAYVYAARVRRWRNTFMGCHDSSANTLGKTAGERNPRIKNEICPQEHNSRSIGIARG